MVNEILFEGKCDFCGKEDRKATAKDLNGITWLWPDLKWICAKCLTFKQPLVGVSQ